MTDREKLIEILRVPIYPHELADPTEAVADYLLDNDVVPVVRCKDCKHWRKSGDGCGWCEAWEQGRYHDNYCNYGERKNNG